jgi:hypothetical protein
MQYWSDEEYDCVDLEFYFGSVMDMISVKIKKDDGSFINIHSNVDGRRLSRDLRKKRKKKVKEEAAPVVDNSPPLRITKLNDKQIVL